MIEQLKSLALRKLTQKMLSNSLSESATSEAASEGANALLESIKGGNIGQLTALFGGAGAEAGESGIAGDLQGKLKAILQSKGMSEEEATAESQNTAGDLISGLKEKFQSESEEDKAFDLGNITSLIGGDAGNILNTAKKLFG